MVSLESPADARSPLAAVAWSRVDDWHLARCLAAAAPRIALADFPHRSRDFHLGAGDPRSKVPRGSPEWHPPAPPKTSPPTPDALDPVPKPFCDPERRTLLEFGPPGH